MLTYPEYEKIVEAIDMYIGGRKQLANLNPDDFDASLSFLTGSSSDDANDVRELLQLNLKEDQQQFDRIKEKLKNLIGQ